MTASKRYNLMSMDKMLYVNRAEEVSKLTIPSLFPDTSFTAASSFDAPYNSVGARAVNYLASKLVLALLPPNAPFFRLTIDDKAGAYLDQDPNLKITVQLALSTIERRVSREIEIKALRPQINYAVKLLIVTGNALVHMPKEGGLRVFSLRNYTVERDPAGNVCEIVLKESLSKSTLPKELRDFIKEDKLEPKLSDDKDCDIVSIYTHIDRQDDGKFKVYQEVNDTIIPSTMGSYEQDNLPFLALRWNAISGENYGRGLGEELLGDLASLESLSKSIVIAAAASARVIGMVSPTGFTNPKDLNDAKDGTFVMGNQSDVSFLQVQKGGDLNVAMETANSITRRIEAAFLLNSSVQRQAERVTAEEFRTLTNELESALGGTYSVLSQELQLPLVRLLMNQLTKSNKITAIPSQIKEYIHPAIVTGVEALGRGSDLERLRAYAAIMASTFGADNIRKHINPSVFGQQTAIALGLDIKGLVYTDEEAKQIIDSEQAAVNAANFTKSASGPAIGGIMNMIANQQQPQTQT